MIIDGLDKHFNLISPQPYCFKLFSAMFAAAYYGLLRIGEVAKGPHVVLAKNVQIGVNKPKLLFIHETSKTHTRGDKPQMAKIEKLGKKTAQAACKSQKKQSEKYCPFKLLQDYKNAKKTVGKVDE